MNTVGRRAPLSVILIPMLGRPIILFGKTRYVIGFIHEGQHLFSLRMFNIFKHLEILTNFFSKTLLIVPLLLQDLSSGP